MNPNYFLTAYEIAVKHGFRGTEEEWLTSLTAFYLARKAGFQGTEEEWLKALNDPVPAIRIGSVTTLEGGSEATATITGDKKNPVLNLGIPRGLGMLDALPLIGGTMRGVLNMNGFAVENVPKPSKDHHAANKEYVDDRLKKDGTEAMTGPLDMGEKAIKNLPKPSEDHHAANKEYVDERLKKDGTEAMKGPLNMEGNAVNNLPTPINDRQAANKGYVDSKHLFRTVALPISGWSAGAPYTQTVVVEGILETDEPHWGLVRSGDTAARIAQKEAFSVIDDLDTADGSVTFTCDEEKPEVDLTIQLEVNR